MSKNVCALIGQSIQASLSPAIHHVFAKQFALDLEYKLIECNKDEVLSTIEKFFTQGGVGLNITSPFKEFATTAVDSLDSSVQLNAINTIYRKGGKLYGANTDGIGFTQELLRNKINLANKRVLVLGAGGVVRAILPQIIMQQPISIHIASRNISKVIAIQQQTSCSAIYWLDIHASNYQEVDVIINALNPNLCDLDNIYRKINFKNSICYDLNYHQNSFFIDYAHINGATMTIDGLGMLIQQAKYAFSLWYELVPDIACLLEKTNRAII